MGEQKQRKLNWLHRNLPEGMIVDAAWLERHGYSRGLRRKYVTHGWLHVLVRGAYCRPSPEFRISRDDNGLRWQSVVISLQTLLQLPVSVGGRTALEIQGFAHYLTPAGPREIHLYGNTGNKAFPGWIGKLPLDRKFAFHNARKLFAGETGVLPADPSGKEFQGLTRQLWGDGEWPLVMSTPERAILELIDEVPQRETFHQADALLDGLNNLSPRRLQPLLAGCRSVKVKRLFLLLAERHNHAWLKKLDRDRIDLGRGKRMLFRGGKLDTKYNITVPEQIDADQ